MTERATLVVYWCLANNISRFLAGGGEELAQNIGGTEPVILLVTPSPQVEDASSGLSTDCTEQELDDRGLMGDGLLQPFLEKIGSEDSFFVREASRFHPIQSRGAYLVAR